MQIDVHSTECPVSVLRRSPQAVELVEQFAQSRNIKAAYGNPSQWPGAFFDAQAILKTQEQIDEAAVQRALHSS